MEAERKFQESLQVQADRRPLPGVQRSFYPPTNDQSPGFWRRFYTIEFNRSFEHDPDKDPDIARKILESERAGILAWLVRGARRLDCQGSYTVPASHATRLARWQTDSDNGKLFAEDFVDVAAEPTRHGSKAVYEAYAAWAKACGYKPLAIKTFVTRISRCSPVCHGAAGTLPTSSRLRFDVRSKSSDGMVRALCLASVGVGPRQRKLGPDKALYFAD